MTPNHPPRPRPLRRSCRAAKRGFFTRWRIETAFVGREAELSLLRRNLEQALRGRGRVVTIAGAPGVGKSRIAREVGTEAFQRGFSVLAGNCYDLDDSVPFIPFVEILEVELAHAASPEAFRAALGED